MSDESVEKSCYVGKAPCGCYLYAMVVEHADAGEFREMAKMVRKGFTIETKTVQWVRDGGLNFDCPNRKRKVKSGMWPATHPEARP